MPATEQMEEASLLPFYGDQNWKTNLISRFMFAILFGMVFGGWYDLKSQSQNANLKLAQQDSLPVFVLNNVLSPAVILTENKNVICIGTDWVDHFPLVAERVDSSGLKNWNRSQVSNPLDSLDQTSGPALMLPTTEGGAHFVFRYWEYKRREETTLFYAMYPHIQLVNSFGVAQWDTNGKRLTNKPVDKFSVIDKMSSTVSPEGDIVVYWDWVEMDSVGNSLSGTFAQKIDETSGELMWGDTGKQLFDHSPWFILTTENRKTYVGHGDSVAVFDPSGNLIWNLPLLSNLVLEYTMIATANENDLLLVLYESGQSIRGRSFDSNGMPLFDDKLISEDPNRIFTGSKLFGWGARWVFSSDSAILALDQAGDPVWNGSTRKLPGRVLDVAAVNEQEIVVAFLAGDTLAVQKFNNQGEPMWLSSGVNVIEHPGTTCRIVPDLLGGAFIVFDALEFESRQRGTYLQRVDRNGNLGVITYIQDTLPQNNRVAGSSVVYPNPSSASTTIQLELSGREMGQSMKLIIYDLLGRRMKTFDSKITTTGRWRLIWDGTDDRGLRVARGIYFYKVLNSANVILSGKIIRIN